MKHITTLSESLDLFKALSSEVRVQIIETLLVNNRISMNQLASQLNITNGALTGHMKKLEECGLIVASNESTGHGNQKLYNVAIDKILIDINPKLENYSVYKTSLRVGQYSACLVTPTCGLATNTALIGQFDDPRYFDHPDHFNADIVWLTEGFLEYTVPKLIPKNQKITQITISAEISSEAPGVNNNWPSDISFYINDTKLGCWTSPGDFGDKKGVFTPNWWPQTLNQYGLLKMVVVNESGAFLDGVQISSITINDLHLDFSSNIKLKISVDSDSNNIGGLTLFGKCFGNYDQDIDVTINYIPIEA